MRHNLILLVTYLTLASCSDNSYRESTINAETARQTSPVPTASNNDTLVVNTITAVFTEPDSLQIEKRKKTDGEETFYSGADDYMYYLNLAHEFLDSIKVKTIVAKGKKYIKFIGSNNSLQFIRTDTLSELWSLYFFDPNKKAKQIDMTVIDEEYKNYFK